MELGKIYLDMGYLTKSLQVHSRALDIAKESDSGKAAHQVNLGESPMHSYSILKGSLCNNIICCAQQH